MPVAERIPAATFPILAVPLGILSMPEMFILFALAVVTAKLATSKLFILAFEPSKFPVTFSVLLTVVEVPATVKLPFTVNPPVAKLPVVAFPLTLNVPPVCKLPAEALPTTLSIELLTVPTFAIAPDAFITDVITNELILPLAAAKLPEVVILPAVTVPDAFIPDETILPMVAFPATLKKPFVKTLPPVILPTTFNKPDSINVAPVIVPLTDIGPADTLPKIALPVKFKVLFDVIGPDTFNVPADNEPVVLKLPALIFAVAAIVAADTNPLVVRLPTLALPSTLKIPLATKFAPDTLPDTLTIVPVRVVVVMLPTLALPTTLKNPFVVTLPEKSALDAKTPTVIKFPADTLPDALNDPLAFKLPIVPLPETVKPPLVTKLPPATFPEILNKLVVLLNVMPDTADVFPPSLNKICVLFPGACSVVPGGKIIFASILDAVIVPVVDMFAASKFPTTLNSPVNKLPETERLSSIPTVVIFG